MKVEPRRISAHPSLGLLLLGCGRRNDFGLGDRVEHLRRSVRGWGAERGFTHDSLRCRLLTFKAETKASQRLIPASTFCNRARSLASSSRKFLS